jgi:hypothetical protein
MTTDEGIHTQISALVAREHDLRAQLQAREIAPDDEPAQLRDSGGDPDAAAVRPAHEVEGYLG